MIKLMLCITSLVKNSSRSLLCSIDRVWCWRCTGIIVFDSLASEKGRRARRRGNYSHFWLANISRTHTHTLWECCLLSNGFNIMYVNAYPPLRMLIIIVIFRIVEPLIWLLIFSPFWGGGGHRGQSIFKTFYSKKWQVKYCCHKINEKENIEICYYMCMKINKVVTLTQITGAKNVICLLFGGIGYLSKFMYRYAQDIFIF